MISRGSIHRITPSPSPCETLPFMASDRVRNERTEHGVCVGIDVTKV